MVDACVTAEVVGADLISAKPEAIESSSTEDAEYAVCATEDSCLSGAGPVSDDPGIGHLLS